MKLGKYLPAVLPVARSQICTAGVFQVTCGTDMTIQVDGKLYLHPYSGVISSHPTHKLPQN